MTGTYIGLTPRYPMDWRVVVSVDGETHPLPLCLDIVNHSPDGFAWGYAGSGPAQLALAILCDAIGPERARDPRLYQRFKGALVVLDKNAGFEMARDDVLAWITRNEG